MFRNRTNVSTAPRYRHPSTLRSSSTHDGAVPSTLPYHAAAAPKLSLPLGGARQQPAAIWVFLFCCCRRALLAFWRAEMARRRRLKLGSFYLFYLVVDLSSLFIVGKCSVVFIFPVFSFSFSIFSAILSAATCLLLPSVGDGTWYIDGSTYRRKEGREGKSVRVRGIVQSNVHAMRLVQAHLPRLCICICMDRISSDFELLS